MFRLVTRSASGRGASNFSFLHPTLLDGPLHLRLVRSRSIRSAEESSAAAEPLEIATPSVATESSAIATSSLPAESLQIATRSGATESSAIATPSVATDCLEIVIPRVRRAIPFPISLALLMAACPAQGAPDATTTAMARILQMEDERQTGPELLNLLADSSPQIRTRAALAVGRIGQARDVSALAALLQDGDAGVRQTAAFALGEIEDSTAADPLANLLVQGKEKDAGVRALAAEGLGKLRRHPEACLVALRDDHLEVQAAALLAAWKIPVTGHVEEIVQMAPHKNVEIRWTAAYCLMRFLGAPASGRTPIPGGINLTRKEIDAIAARLVQLADDESPRVRLPAVRGLRTIGTPEATKVLDRHLADSDWRVRVEAIRAFATAVPESLGGPRIVPLDSIIAAIHDDNANVGVTALEALARAGEESAAVAALEAQLAHPNPRFREVAFESWVARARASIPEPAPSAADTTGAEGTTAGENAIAPPATPTLDATRSARLVEIAHRLLADHHWSVRAAVAGALDLLPESERLQITRGLIEDDKRVAKLAYPALFTQLTDGESDPSTPRILQRIEPDLTKALLDDDPIIRIAALDAVRELYDAKIPEEMRTGTDPAADEDMKALADLLRQTYEMNAGKPELADVRQSAIDIASAYLPHQAAAFAFVSTALTDASYPVRKSAVAAIRGASTEPSDTPALSAEPVGTGRSLEDYIAILEWAKRDHKAVIETDRGQLEVRLFSEEAPLTCWNFAQLAESKFYDDGRWHRVVPDFVLQDGCPRGDGWGGPPHTIRCEINRERYLRGALGMALSGKDTGGSQFFFTHSDQPHLDGGYTVFGTMLRGHEVMDQIAQGEPIESIRVVEE